MNLENTQVQMRKGILEYCILHIISRGEVYASDMLDELTAAGVPVFADAFALRERGIPSDRLRPGVEPALLDIVIDRLLDGWQVIWH